MAERIYNVSHELRGMAEKLVSRYYLYLGTVDLDNIFFAEIEGEKPKRGKVMEVSGIRSAWVKQERQKDNKTLYCLSVWGEDWDDIDPYKREWMVFDALMRISPINDGSLRKPDIQEFGCIVEFLGPYWREKEQLPGLLDGDEALPIPLPRCKEEDEGSTVNF